MPRGAKDSVVPNGFLLRKERKEKGLSREELSDWIKENMKYSVSVSTIQRAERNYINYKISKEKLKYIVLGLGFDNPDRFILKQAIEPKITTCGKFQESHETYQVTDIIKMNLKNRLQQSGRVSLVKSSVANSSGYMDVSHDQKSNLYVDRYSFSNSFSHLFFSPGKIIIPIKDMESRVISNDYPIDMEYVISDNVELPNDANEIIKDENIEKVQMLNVFKYDLNYSGPDFKYRKVIIGKGIGILYCEILYGSGKEDRVILTKFDIKIENNDLFPVQTLGNFWEYKILHQNPYNITNFCE